MCVALKVLQIGSQCQVNERFKYEVETVFDRIRRTRLRENTNYVSIGYVKSMNIGERSEKYIVNPMFSPHLLLY